MSTPKTLAETYAAKVVAYNPVQGAWTPVMREMIGLMIENAYLTGFNKGLTAATEIHRAATRTE